MPQNSGQASTKLTWKRVQFGMRPLFNVVGVNAEALLTVSICSRLFNVVSDTGIDPMAS